MCVCLMCMQMKDRSNLIFKRPIKYQRSQRSTTIHHVCTDALKCPDSEAGAFGTLGFLAAAAAGFLSAAGFFKAFIRKCRSNHMCLKIGQPTTNLPTWSNSKWKPGSEIHLHTEIKRIEDQMRSSCLHSTKWLWLPCPLPSSSTWRSLQRCAWRRNKRHHAQDQKALE
jgi:hypothetical protein